MLNKIGSIQSYNQYLKNGSALKKESRNNKTALKGGDSYEPSFKKTMSDARLKNIQKKIKSGFYNSNKVLSDISDSMASIVEKSL